MRNFRKQRNFSHFCGQKHEILRILARKKFDAQTFANIANTQIRKIVLLCAQSFLRKLAQKQPNFAKFRAKLRAVETLN